MTNTFFQAASKVLKKTFTNSAVDVPVLWDGIFNTYEPDMKRPFMTFLPIIPLTTWGVKPEGGSPLYDQASEGTAYTMNYTTYALAYKITEEMELEDVQGLIKLLPKQLMRSGRITQELLFWNLLNLGFTAGVNGADGQNLFSTGHTVTGAANVSNSGGTVALTPEALQQAIIAFQTLVDDRGIASSRTPMTLVVPPQLAKIAEEVVGSAKYPYSNENRPNVVAGSVTPLVSRWITSTTAWYLLAGKGDLEGDTHSLGTSFKWRDRQATWRDEATGNISHRASFRCAYGFVNWRGSWGSQGS